MGERVLEPLDGSPLWHVLWTRFSTRFDQALVFMPHGVGEARVVQPRNAPVTTHPRVTLAQLISGQFARAFRVSLREYPENTVIEPAGMGVRFHVQFTWWVHDAVRVAERRVSDPLPLVRGSLESRLTDALAGLSDAPAEEVERVVQARLEAPHRLEDVGVSYRVSHAAVDRPSGNTSPPEAGPMARREAELSFYQELVRGAPATLLAFWLMQDPTKVRDVLEWLTNHKVELGATQDGLRSASAQTCPFTRLDRHELRKAVQGAVLALGRISTKRCEELLDPEGGADDGPAAGAA
ncbi:hypothetical protein LI90_454 [Carbonactinospora thermoautotrophica]|uniref:Uncharacterized protein n=1 Tax=Carbonactinospora thermoautotrophica TaxID=1469144 RepID=A0A132MM71_9ACTN|nr:hypothetical protein [Carbonactinospora thermoautotrophica]KWW98825.1 hypothetical protein LI90_454 [Carbonactinospora thermoautotrophica]